MGFFSQDCYGCGHPLLCIDACSMVNEWMNDVVVIDHDGTLHTGTYDGYGRVGDTEYDDDAMRQVVGQRWNDHGQPSHDGPTVWHRACWEIAGSPTDWRGESRGSDDQGWFFDPADHAMPRPRHLSDLTALPAEPVAAPAAVEVSTTLWVTTITLVDTECYAEGTDVTTFLHASREGAVASAKLWYDEFTGDDDDYPELLDVHARIEALTDDVHDYVEVERGTYDITITINERNLLP